jgi:hypothetical protein
LLGNIITKEGIGSLLVAVMVARAQAQREEVGAVRIKKLEGRVLLPGRGARRLVLVRSGVG